MPPCSTSSCPLPTSKIPTCVLQNLDAETLGRIDYQNRLQTLMEELDFLRRVHDQEVNELQALINMQPADTKSFFQNEIALAIRDIRDEYDNIALQVKADTESWYRLKVGSDRV